MKRRPELLESSSVSDITRSKAFFEELVEFHWAYYSELAFQRNRIREQLRDALRGEAEAFAFASWQRTIKYQYSLNPLSTKGSLTDPGGRFNIGRIDPTRYPVFSALYIASDKETALAETLGGNSGTGGLSPAELALTRPDSVTIVSVSGKLESVLDIRKTKSISSFVDLVRSFRLSESLMFKARKLSFPVELIKSTSTLSKVLRQRNWREWPMHFDVPATCQIFGSLVMTAGIESILYDSSITAKPCLAVFPPNFSNSSSYVEIDDNPPRKDVKRRMDATNFGNFL